MMPLTVVLNPEQQKAVEHAEGPLLVIAGPGSGKTRVIAERIVHLIESRGTPPESILALTFTDKASGEMRRRVRAALPGLDAIPHISTFHAFCYQILRERHFERQLLDKVDVWIFLRRRIGELRLDYYQKLAEPGAFLHDLNEFFSRCQDELIEPQDFEAYVQRCEASLACRSPALSVAAGSGGPLRRGVIEPAQTSDPALSLEREDLARKRELARVFRKSRELIEEAGYSSFGSLLSETLRLWAREPDALTRLQARYRYILVDEFQDTNFAQVELLRRLSTAPYNITAVGDDDQAIYRFRGASHGAFQMFDRIFPGRTTVHLDHNYRSVKKILRAADVVISKNDRYEEKRALRTDNAEGSNVCLVESPDYRSEAAWIAGEVERLRRRGVRFGDMAVLYRGHHHRDPLVEEFRRREIPFDIRGLSILSTAILRDLVAYLNLVHSPHHNVSLTRVLIAPRWRFPEELALDIREQASRLRCSLYEALEARERTLFKGELEGTGWPDLNKLLKDVRNTSARMPMPLVLDALIQQLGITFLADDPDRVYVTAFRKFLEEWQKKNAIAAQGGQPHNGRPRATRSALTEFMDYFEYFVEAGGIIEAPEPLNAADVVQMMTVHAAKGLEFPVVFILSVARQRFPHRRETPVIEFPDELRKGPPPPPDIHLQEERRLFYVAMTRAAEHLYVSSVAQPQRKPSVFVDDLLRDPAVTARDIERIHAPQASPAPQGREAATPGSTPLGRNPPSRTDAKGQGILFDDPGASDSPVHPDLLAWISNTSALPRMARDGRLILSATSIEAYRDCPLRFKFSHYLKIPTAPQAALTFGSIMHQSVRHYFELRKKVLPRFEDVELFYMRSWKDRGFEDSYQEEAYKNAGLEQLSEFVKHQNSSDIDSERTVFEQGFSLDLGEVVLIGRIDQINPLDQVRGASPGLSGASPHAVAELPVELIDYKTGRPRSQKDADKSLQLSVYALAAERVLKLDPVRLTFYNLANNEAVSTVRTAADLERAAGEIRAVAALVRQQLFDPTPGFVCRRCDYVPLCPAQERE